MAVENLTGSIWVSQGSLAPPLTGKEKGSEEQLRLKG